VVGFVKVSVFLAVTTLQKMSKDFDPDILDKIKKGDQIAINLVKGPIREMTIHLFKHYGINNFRIVDEFVNDVISEVILRKTPILIETSVMGFFRNVARNLICRHLRYKITRTNHHEDFNGHLETLPFFDQAIPIWELAEIIELCSNRLSKKEHKLMEGILEEKSSEELVKQLGFKNNEVLYVRTCKVKAKFRILLQKHGVDFC
jgi:hypothetical protein